jgi:hypothetical protein
MSAMITITISDDQVLLLKAIGLPKRSSLVGGSLSSSDMGGSVCGKIQAGLEWQPRPLHDRGAFSAICPRSDWCRHAVNDGVVGLNRPMVI